MVELDKLTHFAFTGGGGGGGGHFLNQTGRAFSSQTSFDFAISKIISSEFSSTMFYLL